MTKRFDVPMRYYQMNYIFVIIAHYNRDYVFFETVIYRVFKKISTNWEKCQTCLQQTWRNQMGNARSTFCGLTGKGGHCHNT